MDREKKGNLLELVKFIILAFLIVAPIRIFIAQPFIVSGNSMVPTFEDGEYLIVDEISYRFGQPRRGDVIIFRYPKDPSKFFIKRIIGLPNETVFMDGQTITIKNKLHPEGIIITEPYIKNQANNNLELSLGEDEFFVLGDNRVASSDSRFWGVLPGDLIIGRAFLRLLPIDSIDVRPGQHNLDE